MLELIKEARTGNNKAYLKVWDTQKITVNTVLRQQYTDIMYDKDDLISHCHIGMLRAIKKYDPKRSNRFDTFALYHMRSEFSNNVTKPRIRRSYASKGFSKKIVENIEFNQRIEEIITTKECIPILKKSLTTEMDKCILQMRLSKKSIKEIAFQLNISTVMVRKCLKNMWGKINVLMCGNNSRLLEISPHGKYIINNNC